MLNFEKILTSMHSSNVSVIAPLLTKHLKKFSDEDQARILANMMVETMNFSIFVESGYYTTAERLKSVYPTAFVKKGYNAYNYLRNSEKLFNLVYSSEVNPSLGNGNIASGDGYKYRGRGALQTTGRHNYQSLSDITKIDFIKNPELLQDPETAIKSAVIFWNTNNGSSAKDLISARKVVAGSQQGYSEFLSYYKKIKAYS